MPDQPDEKILHKIQLLLNLSKSSNVHEAALAMQKAQELLFKYNLSIQDLPKDEKRYKKEKYIVGTGRVVSWARDLLFPLARTNFCKAFYWHNIDSRGHLHRVDYMMIVGEPHNLEVLKYVHSYCREEIVRLSESLWLTEGTGSKASWKKNFCWGAVQGVSDKVYEQWLKDQKQTSDSKAMVHVKDADLDKAIIELGIHGRPMSLAASARGAAYDSGREHGKNIQVSHGLNNPQNQQKLLG